MYDDGIDPDAPFDDDVWELYHVAEDFVGVRTTSPTQHPEQLAELVDLWWEEAERYQVLPLDNRPVAALLAPRRPLRTSRERYVFWPDGAPVPETVTVNVRNRIAHASRPTSRSPRRAPLEGVLLAMGTTLGGWSFHVLDGRLRYVHNYVGKERYAVGVRRSSSAPGRARARVLVHQRRRLHGAGTAARRRTASGRPDPDDHAGALLDHRGGHHVRVGAGPAGGRRATTRRSGSRARCTGCRRGRRRRATATGVTPSFRSLAYLEDNRPAKPKPVNVGTARRLRIIGRQLRYSFGKKRLGNAARAREFSSSLDNPRILPMNPTLRNGYYPRLSRAGAGHHPCRPCAHFEDGALRAQRTDCPTKRGAVFGP